MKEYRTRLHVVLEAAAWLLLLLTVLLTVYGIHTLPETIATHYNAAGEADGYGSPVSLLVTPLLMVIPLGIISLVVHFVRPEFWNTPFAVKPENASAVYRDMTTLMLAVQAELSAYTLYLQITWLCQKGMGLASTIVFLFILFATIVVLSLCAWRHNRKE